jgi:predicted GNAT family acetyltransferase
MTKPDLQHFTDPAEFTRLAEPFLLRHEATHCLQLGLLGAMSSGEWPDRFMAAAMQGAEPVLIALRTPPFALILSHTESIEALELLVSELQQGPAALLPDEVMGPGPVSDEFARLWARRAGWQAKATGRERIYQLDQVIPISGVDGQVRRATEADRELLLDWYAAFLAEALPGSPGDAATSVERALASEHRQIWLWTDGGEPVALAGSGNPTLNGVRIGPVYTPPERRKRGYASALVAQLSQDLLDSGHRFCFLFTDLNNPTSNHIYQEVGYRPVSDVNKYALSTGSPGGSNRPTM